MIRGQVTVTVTPATDDISLLDCTDCGPMGSYPFPEVSKTVYDHMMLIHGCDPNTIDLRNP